MALGQGPGLYKGGKEIYKSLAKTTVRKKKGPKQSIKKYQKTIYSNIILARQTLVRYIGVKGTEAVIGKRYLSYSIVNAVGGENLKALKRPNKGRKYNSNTLKDRDNRAKRLALLSRYLSRQPKV